MSLTTDRNDPRLKEGQKNETGQHEVYLVLSDEERAKGFVRPVRKTYVHVGRLYDHGVELLAKPYNSNGKTYVATANIFSDGKKLGGTFITQEELNQYNNTGGFIGGCGTATTMGQALAETYARNPSFYGATFCCGCNRHIGVHEFFWEGTKETVGS